jgi:hypothetical protein
MAYAPTRKPLKMLLCKKIKLELSEQVQPHVLLYQLWSSYG